MSSNRKKCLRTRLQPLSFGIKKDTEAQRFVDIRYMGGTANSVIVGTMCGLILFGQNRAGIFSAELQIANLKPVILGNLQSDIL
jgi:hypothetical protein